MSKETIATTLMLAGSILSGVAYCVAQQSPVSQSQTSQAHRPDQTMSAQNPPAHRAGTTVSPNNLSPTPNMPAPPPTAQHGIMINAIFSQLNPSDPLYDRFGSVLASPLIDGVSTALNWATIDQGPGAAGGQYQWRTFDRGIQRFIDAGKKVNLMVQPISYGSTNTATPSYVMNDTGVEKVSCQGGPGGANYANFPVVYEKTFKNSYKAFIAQVIQHYANNSHIGYIRFGLSIGNEIFPQCAKQESARAGLTIPQWRDQVWLPYHKEMMRYEKSLNPTMQIESPMTPWGGETIWTDTEAANAVAEGFGFGLQGLQASDMARYPTCTGDWCNLFNKYAGQAPILQLSTLGPTDPSGTCSPPSCSPGQRVTGPLPPLLAFAVQHHANTFELYPLDLLIAFDPKHPHYEAYHSAYAAAIAAAHGRQ
jgi:hypothetical protein